jgi:hypothetical protein
MTHDTISESLANDTSATSEVEQERWNERVLESMNDQAIAKDAQG